MDWEKIWSCVCPSCARGEKRHRDNSGQFTAEFLAWQGTPEGIANRAEGRKALGL